MSYTIERIEKELVTAYIEFRPITPRVTHVYHFDRYLGDVCADNEADFLMDLSILLNSEF